MEASSHVVHFARILASFPRVFKVNLGHSKGRCLPSPGWGADGWLGPEDILLQSCPTAPHNVDPNCPKFL